MTTPAASVTDRDDFESQLLDVRKREKAHTREGDAIAAARRRLPMPPDTTVIGTDGPVPFGNVFEGRDELVVYSHMFYDGKPWVPDPLLLAHRRAGCADGAQKRRSTGAPVDAPGRHRGRRTARVVLPLRRVRSP